MIQSSLKQFFTEWYDWATQKEVVDTFHFYKDQGLCACLHNWSKGNVDLNSELINLLEKDHKGNYQFPFDSKLENYWQSKSKQQLHQNPKRLAWVRKQLGIK